MRWADLTQIAQDTARAPPGNQSSGKSRVRRALRHFVNVIWVAYMYPIGPIGRARRPSCDHSLRICSEDGCAAGEPLQTRTRSTERRAGEVGFKLHTSDDERCRYGRRPHRRPCGRGLARVQVHAPRTRAHPRYIHGFPAVGAVRCPTAACRGASAATFRFQHSRTRKLPIRLLLMLQATPLSAQ